MFYFYTNVDNSFISLWLYINDVNVGGSAGIDKYVTRTLSCAVNVGDVVVVKSRVDSGALPSFNVVWQNQE